ncbi:Pepsin A-4 [Durusdinium trenchii]|uniref:Pepsin A-4 n=1 Tax=Durusdinium trenchii TaxID=1381693 RepID=A0ABP0MHC7_9DINO
MPNASDLPPVPPVLEPCLDILKDDKWVERHSLSAGQQRWTLGRAVGEVDFVMQHAALSRGSAGIYLMDLNSGHGIFLDGQRIEKNLRVLLKHGAAIRFRKRKRTRVCYARAAMLRWAALAAVLAAAVCADESFDHAVSVDADGRTNEYSHHLESEPLSLSEITPHWSLDDAALLPQQHVTNSQPSQSEEDESADDESTDDDGDDEESSEEAVGTEKGNFSFSYRQHVTGSTPTGPLGIGTPSVGLNMILDTGSDKFVAKTWSTIKAELDKIDAGASEEVFPGNKIYNHNSSKSYMQLFASQHGRKVPRQGFIAYGSGMAITLEGKETIRVGTDERFISMHKFPISEISLDSLQILHSSKGISGILGLQHMMNRSLGQSFYSVLRDKGILNSFGYCRGKDNDGTFIWGDKSSDGKAVDVAGQMHWAVTVKNMHVKKHKHHATSFMERFDARSSDEEDAAARLGDDMHVSLPPSAYIMKVQMPRLKEDPNSQAEDSEMRSATSENADANLEEDDDDEASDDAKAVGSTRFRMARRHEAAELTEEEAREAQEAQTQRYQAQVDSLVEERLANQPQSIKEKRPKVFLEVDPFDVINKTSRHQ